MKRAGAVTMSSIEQVRQNQESEQCHLWDVESERKEGVKMKAILLRRSWQEKTQQRRGKKWAQANSILKRRMQN